MMTATPSDRDPLDAVAEEFLASYRRGERPSLAEYVREHPDLAEEIRDLFPTLIMLEDVRPGFGSPEASPGPPTAPRGLGEYRIIREIGRGGMGVVYEAEQESLKRRVAIKVLPPGSLDDPKRVERFRREARAAARLHHTNLVPLFGVGEEAGTHFYVMQYIEGRPLDEVLDELRRLRYGNDAHRLSPADPTIDGQDHLSTSASPSSADIARSLWNGDLLAASRPGQGRSTDSAAALSASGVESGSKSPLPCKRTAPTAAADSVSDPREVYARKVAHLGVQVADALEYAAAQGVLHRDVKPSNLLLDMNGTVWLTDFGLAKTVGTTDLTLTGDLFGTLRYMAPERLRGRADIRSDVYALGLTLYEMLALRHAFDDRGHMALVERITRDEPPRLNELDPELPRDLATIVHKAIAKDPADRYQNPRALSDDLRRFLEDRPILARRQSVPEQVRRWCRRNPVGATLTGAVAALIVLAVVGGLRLQRQQAERELEAVLRENRARRTIEALFSESDGLRKRSLWTAAGAVLGQAERLLDDARLSDLWGRLRRERLDFDLVAKLESIRLNRDGLHQTNRLDAAKQYASAFAGIGLNLGDASSEAANAARIRSSSLRELLVAALDDWALVTTDDSLRTLLLRVTRDVDPDPAWRDRVRDPKLWKDLHALEQLAAEVPDRDPPPQLLATLGVLIDDAGGNSEPLLRAAQLRRPDDFWLNYELAMLLRSRDPEAALGFARAALAKRPQSAPVSNLCGLAAWAGGRTNEAAAAYRRAIELDPGLAAPHTNLGLLLQSRGRREEALAEQRKAVALDPNGALGFNNLGDALAELGRFDEAIASYRHAIALEPKLALPYNGLGNVFKAQGCSKQAAAAYRDAVALDPNGSAAVHNLGNSLRESGEIEEATAAYRRAIELDRKGPMAHLALLETLQQAGRFEEAHREARSWVDQLGGEGPRSVAIGQLERCERLLALNARLPRILAGHESLESAQDRRELAWICLFTRRSYAAAAHYYESAFAARPELAADLDRQDRYNAACAAALAAAARGTDAESLTESQRATLRRKALCWLRADLARWIDRARDPEKHLDVARALDHWRADPDLESIRDPKLVLELAPNARADCEALWKDVAELRARIDGRSAPQTAELVESGSHGT